MVCPEGFCRSECSFPCICVAYKLPGMPFALTYSDPNKKTGQVTLAGFPTTVVQRLSVDL
jgi:hypothetical protein